MASFRSGVMISKSESDRRKGDEMRMRKQGIDPSKGEDLAWGGAVVSRRQHRVSRVDKEAEKDLEEAEAFQMDAAAVIIKKPEGRLKWLQRALLLAGKHRGRVQIGAVYDIVTQAKFVSGVSKGVGAQMRTVLMANLHLFSQKQQRALQSESGRFSSFGSGGGKGSSSEDESAEPRRRSSPAARRAKGGGSPARRGGGSRSRSPKRQSRSKSPSTKAEARPSKRRRSSPSRSRSRSKSRSESQRSKRRGSARKREEPDRRPNAGGAGSDSAAAASEEPAAAAPALKIKMSKWQPLCVRNAVASIPK